jgi:hypothetical protein
MTTGNIELAQRIVASLKNGWPTPVKYLGGGVNGRIYETNNGRLIKFIYGAAPVEYEALRNLQGTHIVPRFENKAKVIKLVKSKESVRNVMFPNQNLSNYLTVFLMGKVGGNKGMTLWQYLKKYPNANKASVQRRVEYLVEQMHLRGWAHGNLHAGNIIVSVNSDGKITGMWVIDFGRGYRIKRGKTERETWIAMSNNKRLFRTGSVFAGGPNKNIPLRGSVPRRADVHMMNTHYEKRIEPAQERKWRNIRQFAVGEVEKFLKSPKKRTLRRSKSAPASASPKKKSPPPKKRSPRSTPRPRSI